MGEVATADDGLLWSISKTARVSGKARETVAKSVADAGLRPAGNKLGYPVYLSYEILPAIYAKESGAQGFISDENFDPAKLPPKERKDYYDSEKARLVVEKEKRQLIHAEDYRRELASVCKAVAIFMETLPDILERDCGLDPVTIARIQASADEQRTSLADRVESLESGDID
jgi:hypothetical protein